MEVGQNLPTPEFRETLWAPQPGPQLDAILARWCPILFFGGARGGGKTQFLLGDFLQDVAQFGGDWRGILFRRSFPELDEVIAQSLQIFAKTGGQYKVGDKTWKWANGASLKFRQLERDIDADKYQGHQYTWIGWDELGQWPTAAPFRKLLGSLRSASTAADVKRVRATGNPGGAGHEWIKSLFIDPAPLGYVPIEDPATRMVRMFIPSRVKDNRKLLEKDPGYVDQLRGVGSPALVRAWLDGDWNAVLGAYFPEFSSRHIIKPCELPRAWVRFRAIDWGSAKPFSVGWYAVSDGSISKFPRGALIKYRELYGCESPNVGLRWTVDQLAQAIVEHTFEDITYTVADPACFAEDGGPSLAERLHRKGVTCRPADNKRLPGWDQLRSRLLGEDDKPMIYFFDTCTHTIRTFPTAQHDSAKPEDLDTDCEDHALDETRYAVMSRAFIRDVPQEKPPVDNYQNLTLNDLWTRQQQFSNRSGRI